MTEENKSEIETPVLEKKKQTRDKKKGNKKEEKRKFSWPFGVAATILLVLVVLLVVTIAPMSIEQYAHTHPEFCSVCHIMESHVDSYVSGNTLDNVHKQAGVECTDCHTEYTMVDEVKSAFQYITNDYDKYWSRRKFDDTMCNECHISLEYQAKTTDHLTRNPHASHWPELRCASCHISHDEQEDYCSRCHDNGGQRMTGDPIIPREFNKWTEEDPDA